MTDNAQGSQSKLVVFISTAFLAACTIGLIYMAYHGPFPDSVFAAYKSSLLTPVAAICAVCTAGLTFLGIKRLLKM